RARVDTHLTHQVNPDNNTWVARSAVPSSSSRATRIAFGVAAALVLVALALHFSTWLRRGVVDWPAARNMLGILVLTSIGMFDPPHGRLRLALTLVALALIVPSAFFMFSRL